MSYDDWIQSQTVTYDPETPHLESLRGTENCLEGDIIQLPLKRTSDPLIKTAYSPAEEELYGKLHQRIADHWELKTTESGKTPRTYTLSTAYIRKFPDNFDRKPTFAPAQEPYDKNLTVWKYAVFHERDMQNIPLMEPHSLHDDSVEHMKSALPPYTNAVPLNQTIFFIPKEK